MNSFIEVQTCTSKNILYYHLDVLTVQRNIYLCQFNWNSFILKAKETFTRGVRDIGYSKFESPYFKIELPGLLIDSVGESVRGLNDIDEYYLAALVQAIVQLGEIKGIKLMLYSLVV
jgi:hypothetical protein